VVIAVLVEFRCVPLPLAVLRLVQCRPASQDHAAADLVRDVRATRVLFGRNPTGRPAMILATFLFALLPAIGTATLFFPALTLAPGKRVVALVAVALPIALSPLLVPAPAVLLRYLVAANAVTLLLKLYDPHHRVTPEQPPTWRVFFAFLLNGVSVLLRDPAEAPAPSRRQNQFSLPRELA
jgi:hypothetical protein